jgi:hypothetical protein
VSSRLVRRVRADGSAAPGDIAEDAADSSSDPDRLTLGMLLKHELRKPYRQGLGRQIN